MTFLICRTAWMPFYKSSNEAANSQHRYIKDKNRPYECYNFLQSEYGDYLGYVRVGKDAQGNFGKLNIERLGGSSKDDQVENVSVVFCATRPGNGGLYVTGIYHEATVLRTPIIDNAPNGDQRIIRIRSKNATLIPESDRVLSIPSSPNGVGRNDIWYGINDDRNSDLRDELEDYIANAHQYSGVLGETIDEHRKRKSHEHWEGRARSRHLIHQLGFQCQACGYKVKEADRTIWGSGLELHHLAPWSLIEDGAKRELTSDDFAVLCAICHKAIHRTDDVSDISAFVKNHLKHRKH